MKKVNAKIEMLEHSEAKVDLYRRYLATYLNILSRVSSVKRIYLFDLFCGEGVYENNLKGSPLIALDVIRNHYFANNHTCPNMSIWFNDNGISQIEGGIHKVDRVKRFCSTEFVPAGVSLEFYPDDYEHVLPLALRAVTKVPGTKGLFFLDQYGYKVDPENISAILKTDNSEALLFLPISFMYRFAAKSMQSDFSGGEPLHLFLTKLFGPHVPRFTSAHHFLAQIKEGFKTYLAGLDAFVDAFSIQRDSANLYALLFFTTNIRGYEKMLEAKWGVDTALGAGHRLQKAQPLFDAIELEGYPQKLESFIGSSDYRTNEAIYCFGLENGFLPKHTNEALRRLKQSHNNLEVFALDSKSVRGFYISYNSDRRVGFRFRDA